MSQLHSKLGSSNEILNKFESYMNKSQNSGNKEEAKEQSEKHGHIPDFLLCRITDDFMEEPVIIQSGFTYEKKAILKHFQINGCTDPITR
jgi:STIP1 family protein 1